MNNLQEFVRRREILLSFTGGNLYHYCEKKYVPKLLLSGEEVSQFYDPLQQN